MKYIEQALATLNEIRLTETEDLISRRTELNLNIERITAAALKELKALEQAGIDVLTEQIEHVTVIRPKSKRGRKAKNKA